MNEDAFWAALDVAIPRWRARSVYPYVFAGFLRSGTGSVGEQAREVVRVALGPTLDPDAPLEEALDVRLDRAGAHAAIERGLRRTPAYNTEWVTASKAGQVADAFVACFHPDAEFLTNGDLWLPNEDDSASWTGVTSATFDTGVVAVADAAAGTLWVTDED